MAAAIKTVSDALIEVLATEVAALNPETVSSFAGSLEEFARLGRNLPFVGVSLAEARYLTLNSDSSLAEEHLTFRLTAVAGDFRGPEYSLESSYGLVDGIRDTLLGRDLGLSGLAPLSLRRCEMDREAEKAGLTVYRFEIATWQVIQPV